MKCNNCTGKCICKPKKTCACPVPNLTSHCVEYNGEKLECSGIDKGGTINDIFKKLDRFICERMENISGAIGALVNIGNGKKLFKGTDGTGRSQIRTLVSSDNSVSIEEDNDTIDLKSETVKLKPVGDGNPIYIGEDDGGKSEITSLKDLKEPLDNEGVSVYKQFNTFSKNHEFRALKNTDGTLDILQTNNYIEINSKSQSYSDNSFYVDVNYSGDSETGTIYQPYKTLDAALTAFIGDGTNGNPEFAGSSIIVIGNGVHEFSGNMSINKLSLIIESQSIVRYVGNENYPIDFGFIQTAMGGSSAQREYIYITISGNGRFESNRSIARVVGGTLGSRSTNPLNLDGNYLRIEGNIHFYSYRNIHNFQSAKDLDGNDWTFEDIPVLFFTGEVVNYPLFKCEGLKSNIVFNNIATIEALSHLLIECKDFGKVVANRELITINSNPKYAVISKPVQDAEGNFPTLGIKGGLSMVNIESSGTVILEKGINNKGKGLSRFNSIYRISGIDSVLKVSNDSTINGGSDALHYIHVIGDHFPKIELYKNNITKELLPGGTFIYDPDVGGTFSTATYSNLIVFDNIFNFDYNADKIDLTGGSSFRTVTNYFKGTKIFSMPKLSLTYILNNPADLPTGTIVWNTTCNSLHVVGVSPDECIQNTQDPGGPGGIGGDPQDPGDTGDKGDTGGPGDPSDPGDPLDPGPVGPGYE